MQDKPVRIISVRANNYDVGELYKNYKILRSSDYIKLLNSLFVREVLTNLSIPPFQNYFIKSENLHQYNTRHAKKTSVILTQQNTDDFYSIKSTNTKQRQHGINFIMKQTTMFFYKTFNQKLKSSLPIKY